MTDERERRKSSGIGNAPRKPPILHFYAISILTEPVPSSSKLVLRMFTTIYTESLMDEIRIDHFFHKNICIFNMSNVFIFCCEKQI